MTQQVQVCNWNIAHKLLCNPVLSFTYCLHVADSGNGRLPLGLKVWKTIPFVEDILVSGTEAVKLVS
jgi:hypothetical protein